MTKHFLRDQKQGTDVTTALLLPTRVSEGLTRGLRREKEIDIQAGKEKLSLSRSTDITCKVQKRPQK